MYSKTGNSSLSNSYILFATKLSGIYNEFGVGNGVFYIDKPEEVFLKIDPIMKNLNETKLKIKNFIEKYDWNNILRVFFRSLTSNKIFYSKQNKTKHH